MNKPDCYTDPLFEDYNGHCLCKDYPDIGYTCNWVSYYFDYDKSEQGLRNLISTRDCYNSPNYRGKDGYCSCSTDFYTGNRYCKFWEKLNITE